MGIVGINAQKLKYAAAHSIGLGNFSKFEEAAEIKKLKDSRQLKQLMDKFGNPLYEECLLPKGLTEAKEALKGLSREKIFKKTGMVVHNLVNGSKAIEDYSPVIDGKTFTQLGVDENKLIKDVVKIFNSMDLKKSNLKTTSSVSEIIGNLHLSAKNKYLKDASSIKKIGGFIQINDAANKKEAVEYLKKIKLNPEVAKEGIILGSGFHKII